jgi:hypothetical protein
MSPQALAMTEMAFGIWDEVLTAVVMKSTTCSDKTSRSPLKVNRRFGEKSRFHHQGRRILFQFFIYFKKIIQAETITTDIEVVQVKTYV